MHDVWHQRIIELLSTTTVTTMHISWHICIRHHNNTLDKTKLRSNLLSAFLGDTIYGREFMSCMCVVPYVLEIYFHILACWRTGAGLTTGISSLLYTRYCLITDWEMRSHGTCWALYIGAGWPAGARSETLKSCTAHPSASQPRTTTSQGEHGEGLYEALSLPHGEPWGC